MKLMSARASVRTALQSPGSIKFPSADNPDARRQGKSKLPKQGAKVKKALLTQTGAF